MDVTAMLNTASTAAAMEPKLELIHESYERKDSSDEDLTDSVQTPSATTTGDRDSTAPSSMVATPLEKTPSRRSSDSSRVPTSRNRTPWDAGGYSLSMALDNTKKLVQVQQQTSPNSRHVLPESIPESMDFNTTPTLPGSSSPRHKFSDSRSSFSSAYTNASSTNNSVAHSRISSLSTVSENQPLSNLIADFSLLETRISEPCINGIPASPAAQQGQGHPQQLKLQQYSFTATQASPSQDFQPESPTPVRSRHDMSTGASPQPSPRSPGRPQSPSDAMLIQRPGQPEESEHFQNPSRLQIPSASSHQRSQSRGDYLQPSNSQNHCHKRAVSAPDFPSITNSSFNPRFPTFGPIPEPTPSPSQHSDGMEHDSASSSPTGPEQTRATPDGRAASSEYHGHSSSGSCEMNGAMSSSPMNLSPPGPASNTHQSHNSISSLSGQASSQQTATTTTQPVNFETASECMYRGDCQTGSQLRKAISHIFGRNKLCTRMIPTGVWVHYCRKHYQRTRYRNGGEYPQRQIGLVQTQIHRVQAWSDSNTQQNRGPVLKDWSLSVRKREQMRLDSKVAANGKKRTFEGMDEEEDNFDDDRAEMSGTAVPEWVVAQIGDGFSTAGILDVVERLKSDIDAGRLQQIPDIEILPNIVTDANSDEPASNNTAKKTYTKRRTASSSGFAASGHRRSQSVNTSALRSDSIPMARRSSQPNNYNYLAPSGRPFVSDYHQQAPMEKRQRTDDEGMGMGVSMGMHMGHRHHHSMGGMPDRFEPPMAPRPGFNGRMQLAHRPAFAGIRESHAEGQASYSSHDEQLRHQVQPQQQQQQYGSAHNDFYPYQRPMPESTPVQGGYATDNRYAQEFEARREHERREHERHHSTSSGVSGPTNDAPAGPAGYGVLPAPNPQRFGATPVAQQLETSQYVLNSTSAAARRPNVHQRSQSEAGFMYHSSSSNNHAFPPRLSTNDNSGRGYAEEVPRTTAYQPYSSQVPQVPPHATHATHTTQPSHYGQAHGHAHSHSHAGHHHHHTHSYSGTQQQEHNDSHHRYYSSPNPAPHHQYEHAPRLAPPVIQTTAPAPMAPAQPADKFDMVQLPPIQNLAPPPAMTAATTADSGAGPTTPQPGSSSPPEYKHFDSSHPRSSFGSSHSHSSSSVTPAAANNTATAATPYTSPMSPKAHGSSPMPQAQV